MTPFRGIIPEGLDRQLKLQRQDLSPEVRSQTIQYLSSGSSILSCLSKIGFRQIYWDIFGDTHSRCTQQQRRICSIMSVLSPVRETGTRLSRKPGVSRVIFPDCGRE
ncbi:hypothetical protein WAI453_007843 [Rhynchosporium graminicola]